MVAMAPVNTYGARELNRARVLKVHACLECGGEFSAHPTLAKHAEFCSPACRKAFNNRRMVRGAELYDLIMALRCDRKAATAFKVWKMICRMISDFRSEDDRERAGRHSWRHPRVVLARHPYLSAIVLTNNIAGNRRK